MDAAHQVSTSIESGDIDLGIAAGVEDMFSVPMGGFAPDFHPELAEQEFYIGMGETAENLANDLSISRDEQEEFAINSHKKALEDWHLADCRCLASVESNHQSCSHRMEASRMGLDALDRQFLLQRQSSQMT